MLVVMYTELFRPLLLPGSAGSWKKTCGKLYDFKTVKKGSKLALLVRQNFFVEDAWDVPFCKRSDIIKNIVGRWWYARASQAAKGHGANSAEGADRTCWARRNWHGKLPDTDWVFFQAFSDTIELVCSPWIANIHKPARNKHLSYIYKKEKYSGNLQSKHLL